MDIKSTSIRDIGLSTRSRNALMRHKINTVEEMLHLNEDDLYQMKSLGVKSVGEILAKIGEISAGTLESAQSIGPDGALPARGLPAIEIPEDFEGWLSAEENKALFIAYLQDRKIRINVLELLPAREYNLLLFSGNDYLEKIVFLSEEQLIEIPKVEKESAETIARHIRRYVRESRYAFSGWLEEKRAEEAGVKSYTIFDVLRIPEYRDRLEEYVSSNDLDIRTLGLSTRPLNFLRKQGWQKLSDFILLDRTTMEEMQGVGKKSIDEIMEMIHAYLIKHEARILAFLNGEEEALWDDAYIRECILSLYPNIGFKGLSFSEMKEVLTLPDSITDDRLKKNIGALLAEGELEYVDFRCHRVYWKFEDCLRNCPTVSDRERASIEKRLQGRTLQEIGVEEDVTRERVRQIVNKGIGKVKAWYLLETGLSLFDEDYYRHLFETYWFDKKDGSEWFGISPYVWRYLDLNDCKMGEKDLAQALEDKAIDMGLRLKIRNYLHRNKILIDGKWIEKRRSALEDVAVRALCRDSMSFDEFTELYNRFLESLDIPYDEELYYTDAVINTRKNKLMDSRMLLWKQNERIRYYDIEAQDYEELFETLNLESYENIDLSTQKFVEEYPELMERYDIRDQYELHNLLRKTVKEGSFHDFHLGKMPMIGFGTFDRDAAIFDLMVENAPVTMQELADIVHQEYGYDQMTVMGSYFGAIGQYLDHGIFNIDQKVMAEEDLRLLKENLKDDFYFIEEVRRIHARLLPSADPEEINPYNLREMGFIVRSGYVLQNQTSLDGYFEALLTREDIMDISGFRKRFTYVQSYSNTLMTLKRNFDVIEFERDQIINYSRLERSGVTKEMLLAFCDEVYDFVEDEACFSMKTLKQAGFDAELFELGFSDWFYSNLLIADERLAYGRIFGNLVFHKGEGKVTRNSFMVNLIKQAGSIDRFDLITEITEDFGCGMSETDQSNLNFILKDAEVFYDQYMDRFYANEELYYKELDEGEGFS